MRELRETLWEVMCGALPAFSLLFALNVVLLVMVGLSFPFVEPGSAAYYLDIISVGLIVCVLAASGYVVRRCRLRE